MRRFVRDFIDLYLILRKTDWKMEDLIKKNKIKFDWHIDYLQLGAQFMQVKTVKDYPRMLEKLDSKEWQNFFIDQVKNFSGKIIN